MDQINVIMSDKKIEVMPGTVFSRLQLNAVFPVFLKDIRMTLTVEFRAQKKDSGL